eukprot:3023431-Rhodomonas_salina.9
MTFVLPGGSHAGSRSPSGPTPAWSSVSTNGSIVSCRKQSMLCGCGGGGHRRERTLVHQRSTILSAFAHEFSKVVEGDSRRRRHGRRASRSRPEDTRTSARVLIIAVHTTASSSAEATLAAKTQNVIHPGQ